MALKDLASDLSAYKGQTTPTSIDNQIENGVDFFDDDTGGAVGFTPKTDLESLYHKVGEGTIVAGPTPPGNSSQFTSGFMTTPIADYLSNFNPPFNESLTFDVEQHASTGPTQFTISAFDNTPSIPNAHGASLLPNLNQFDFSIFRERSRTSETPPFHSSVTAPFDNVTLPSPFLENRYAVEFGSVGVMNLRDRYKDGSIHIEVGDSQSPVGGEVVEFASLMPLVNRTSQFSTPEDIAGDNVYTVPATYPTATPQTTLNLQRENFRTTEDVTIDTFQSEFSATTLKKGYDDSDYIDNLFEFGNGTYKNVPSGMTSNNSFGTKTFREVADPNNFDLFRQPFILREVGNQWGFDQIETDNPIGSFFGGVANTIDSILGGFFRGAPGFTGLVSRSITDKFRIGKFLLTMDGIGFLGKQYALQALNPTLESKIYNPLSTLSITGGGQMFDTIKGVVSGGGTSVADLASGLGSSIVSAFIPIGHPERHVGGGRYEDVNPITQIPDFILDKISDADIKGALSSIKFNSSDKGWGSRIAMQSNPEIIPEITVDAGFLGTHTVGGKDLGTSMIAMNPNKYLFPVSSAPKSVTKSGISFTGGIGDAKTDAQLIESKRGGTFNKDTAIKDDGALIKRHSTLAYSQLIENFSYESLGLTTPRQLDDRGQGTLVTAAGYQARINAKKINDRIGKRSVNDIIRDDRLLGEIKGDATSDNVDRVNMIPYGQDYINPVTNDKNNDFIKFKFHDMVNNKFIIFRAILEGISDSITPEYGEEKYIGRPDKVYIYQGTDRNISFGFKIYPKTKQELPVLMEKLNYLVGMCYPSYTPGERMVTPLMSLTLGDMFNGAMGLLSSLSITVEDATTWEIEDGLQFPHFISAQCEFKYIGNSVLASKGKHYGLSWIPDGSSQPIAGEGATDAVNRFTNTADLGFNDYPNRGAKSEGAKDYKPLFSQLGQP